MAPLRNWPLRELRRCVALRRYGLLSLESPMGIVLKRRRRRSTPQVARAAPSLGGGVTKVADGNRRVLIGYSCSGKVDDSPNGGEAVGLRCGNTRLRQVGREQVRHGAHFRDFTKTRSRRGVESGRIQERDLDSVQPTEQPGSFPAGPALPSRDPEWNNFAHRVAPKVVYLRQSAADVAQGLFERRKSQAKDSRESRHPNFGSGMQTSSRREGQAWVRAAPDIARANIKRRWHPWCRYVRGGRNAISLSRSRISYVATTLSPSCT